MPGSDPPRSKDAPPDPSGSKPRLPRLYDEDDTEATLSTAMQRLRALQRSKPSSVPRLTLPEDDHEEDASRTHQTRVVAQPEAVRGTGRPRITVLTGLSSGTIVPLENRTRLNVGRARGADLRLVDRGVSRQHVRIRRSGDGYLAEDLSSTNGTLLNGAALTKATLSTGDRLQLGPNVVVQFSIVDDMEERIAALRQRVSTRDPVTEAFSRQLFTERLSAEVAYARRHQSPVSLVILELDHVKGSNAGAEDAPFDALVKKIAAIGTKLAREEDTFCRLGHHEFAVIVRGETLRNAAKMAERLRRGVENARLSYKTPSAVVTISVGVCELHECKKKEADALLRMALDRTHRAAIKGGNAVCTL